MKNAAKSLARALALIGVLPHLVSYAVRSRLLGSDRALEGSMQTLGLLPGLTGEYLRRAFLSRVLARCAPTSVIGYGALFSSAASRIDDYAYIGPRCHIGLVHLERDVLLAAGVHVPSGRHTHGTGADLPFREQEGARTQVRIGAGSWIGSNAVVMADVGAGCIVGAGAVVTRPLPPRVLAAGVPARIIRHLDIASVRPA
jgi:virginiamycin A acetyltransferase